MGGHQMNFGGSVVGKASTIGIEISPTLPLIFTGESQKVRNLASFSSLLNFKSLVFERQQDIRTLKHTPCVGMIALWPHQVYEVGSTHPWESSVSWEPFSGSCHSRHCDNKACYLVVLVPFVVVVVHIVASQYTYLRPTTLCRGPHKQQ